MPLTLPATKSSIAGGSDAATPTVEQHRWRTRNACVPDCVTVPTCQAADSRRLDSFLPSQLFGRTHIPCSVGPYLVTCTMATIAHKSESMPSPNHGTSCLIGTISAACAAKSTTHKPPYTSTNVANLLPYVPSQARPPASLFDGVRTKVQGSADHVRRDRTGNRGELATTDRNANSAAQASYCSVACLRNQEGTRTLKLIRKA